MKTDDLIHVLAADSETAADNLIRPIILAGAAGITVSAVFFALVLGPRPDILEVATSARFLFKPIVMLVLAGSSAFLLLRLLQPGVPARAIALALIPAVLAVAAAIELAILPPNQWIPALLGDNWYRCLGMVPLLSLPLATALMVALRRGAPTRPATAGAIAGLVAGGIGAALYAIHCTDDSPLFVALWYSLAVIILGLLGALAGRVFVRW